MDAGGPFTRAILHGFQAHVRAAHLTAYERACAIGDGGGGAYLREQAIYSSQITQWRQLRDAGLLAGKKPGKKVGRPTLDQAEIARLTWELEIARRRLATTEAALGIMGKAHALLEQISESADIEDRQRKR